SFGKEIPMTARFYLESRYQIVPEVIVHDPKRFVQGLRELFGIGSKLVEEIIAKSICKKYGLKENKDLVQVIHEANHVDSW
ncbi:MAG: DUF3227 domain-containing protein, partial [Thaumarchaeota archaeon]|nr:DUF3227 domain-containing protein [Nitrososphaerota archaeon]